MSGLNDSIPSLSVDLHIRLHPRKRKEKETFYDSNRLGSGCNKRGQNNEGIFRHEKLAIIFVDVKIGCNFIQKNIKIEIMLDI